MYALQSLFPSLRIFPNFPTEHEACYIFFNAAQHVWITISKQEVTERDFQLLSSVWDVQSKKNYSPWEAFLLGEKAAPIAITEQIRVLQIFTQQPVNVAELQQATAAFFENALTFVSLSPSFNVLIERDSAQISDQELEAFLLVLEGDFFIHATLYIGKFHTCDATFAQRFAREHRWYREANIVSTAKRLVTMEFLLASHLTSQMTDDTKELLQSEILQKIQEDDTLLHTVRTFFEQGLNASTTAKALHLHRNTLLYRLAKFQELTGINIRQFDGALAVYMASSLSK
ncbi:PucR family transcriptional regulator [Solibacillus sp. FSL H8-0538]|uniref:PucR family transcriptional regulator n=1 Tax=Solibacillus sp. FSL H8-0538 TaxID=2921400 RepID=UPI0030F6073B